MSDAEAIAALTQVANLLETHSGLVGLRDRAPALQHCLVLLRYRELQAAKVEQAKPIERTAEGVRLLEKIAQALRSSAVALEKVDTWGRAPDGRCGVCGVGIGHGADGHDFYCVVLRARRELAEVLQ